MVASRHQLCPGLSRAWAVGFLMIPHQFISSLTADPIQGGSLSVECLHQHRHPSSFSLQGDQKEGYPSNVQNLSNLGLAQDHLSQKKNPNPQPHLPLPPFYQDHGKRDASKTSSSSYCLASLCNYARHLTVKSIIKWPEAHMAEPEPALDFL